MPTDHERMNALREPEPHVGGGLQNGRLFVGREGWQECGGRGTGITPARIWGYSELSGHELDSAIDALIAQRAASHG